MKLKKDVMFTYDEDSKSYVFHIGSGVKIKKVTSRMFPILIGENKFNGVGYGVLDRVGLLDFEPIDPFYAVRGAIAEYFVYHYLKNTYKKHGIDLIMKAFNTKASGYDVFKSNERFSGVPDIGISKPDKHRAVVEVKSKNMKSYEYIIDKKEVPNEEVLQGKMLSHLSKVDKLLMAYVFFTDEQEKLIKDNMGKIKDINDFNVEGFCKFINLNVSDVMLSDETIIRYDINHDETLGYMNKAYENLHRIAKDGVIHASHFTEQEQEYLNNLLLERSGVKEIDLPF